MCGIAGYLSIEAKRSGEVLERMKTAIRHRGPDGEGTWTSPDSRIGLAHLRLSIIDLTTGAQPMTAPSGNVITYNGEIYNFIELRKELGGEGFRTTSDTEVDPAGLREVGRALRREAARHVRVRALGRGQGQTVLRARPLRHQAVLLRDRRRHVSISLLRSRRCCRSCRRSKPTATACTIISASSSASASKTMFSGVRQLEPAHCGYVEADGTLAPGAIGRSTTTSTGRTTRNISSSACASGCPIRWTCTCAPTSRSAPM